jgi:phosphatidylinositol N-acetylglucosaminyltransferase subunit H
MLPARQSSKHITIVEMLGSASQHLTKQSPSSTTISYTVSNALPQSTRPSKILFIFGIVFRVLLCFFVLAVDISKLQSVPHFQYLFSGVVDLQNVHTGRLALTISNCLDWRLVAASSFLIIYFCLRKGYTGVNMYCPSDSAAEC